MARHAATKPAAQRSRRCGRWRRLGRLRPGSPRARQYECGDQLAPHRDRFAARRRLQPLRRELGGSGRGTGDHRGAHRGGGLVGQDKVRGVERAHQVVVAGRRRARIRGRQVAPRPPRSVPSRHLQTGAEERGRGAGGRRAGHLAGSELHGFGDQLDRGARYGHFAALPPEYRAPRASIRWSRRSCGHSPRSGAIASLNWPAAPARRRRRPARRAGTGAAGSRGSPTPARASASSSACANSAPTGMAPASPAPLMPSGFAARAFLVADLDARHVERGRQQVVHERGVQQLAVLVEDQLLVEGVADALRDAAVDLPFDDQRIDARGRSRGPRRSAGSRTSKVSRIDLDDHRVHAARRGAARGAEVGGGLEARLGARRDRAAQRIRAAAPARRARSRAPARRATRTRPSTSSRSSLGALRAAWRAQREDLLAHRLRRGVHGVAGDHRAAAGEGAGAPVELVGVAGHHVDVARPRRRAARRRSARSTVKCPWPCVPTPVATRTLPLGSAPARARLRTGRCRCPRRSRRCPMPTALARGAQARLLLAQEIVVADHRQRLVEQRLVVAAVVDQRREVLEDDLVIVRELVGREQVAPADLGAVDAQLARRQVEQPLDHEDAVLAPGAAVGRDDRLVGEDRA